MRKFVQLPSVSNVAPGNTATIRVPRGPTYERIMIRTNVPPEKLRYVEVIINGKTVQVYQSAAEINDINAYYGRKVKAGYVDLYFARPELHELGMERITAIGTADIESFEIRMDVAPDAAPDSFIRMRAITSPGQPLGLITKVKAFPVSSAVAGDFEVDNLPRGPRIMAMHVYGAGLEYIRCDVNSHKEIETTKEEADYWQESRGRKPTVGAIRMDFLLDADISQALVTEGLEDLRFVYKLGQEGGLRQVVEYLDALPGI